MNINRSWKYLGLLVLFLAVGVRFLWLNKVPAALYYDEIDLGYQVKSLLTTGRDYRGNISPFYFRSFNTDKTPLPIYFSAVASWFFTSPEYQVRASGALAGVLCVVLAMLIAYQLTRNKLAAIITGLVFAFSPWQIHFSRIAFEAIFMMMIFLSSIATFFHWVDTKKRWAYYLSAFLLGLTVYTYRTMSLFAPLTVILLLVIYFRDFWKEGLVRITLWLSIIAVMILPFLYSTTIASADQTRISQISIFADPMVPINVIRNREVDSNDYGNPQIGKKPVWWSPIFHNKLVSFMANFGINYYSNFSSEFLFITGDPNIRHSANNTGELLFVDIAGLALGLIFVVKNLKKKNYQLLLGLLIISPIPADLTMDGARHASRLMILSGPMLLIIALGYMSLVNWLYSRRRYRIGIWFVALVWILAVVFFLQKYFVHFPIESAKQFGYGYKQATEKISELEKNFKSVRLTAFNDPPMLYYLYWSKVPPKDVQYYGTEFGENIIKNTYLDKVKPMNWEEKVCTMKEIARLNPETIYMVNYNNLPLDFRGPDKDRVPTGIKLMEVIKYPNNEVAFYIITRDTKNGQPILPDKITACE